MNVVMSSGSVPDTGSSDRESLVDGLTGGTSRRLVPAGRNVCRPMLSPSCLRPHCDRRTSALSGFDRSLFACIHAAGRFVHASGKFRIENETTPACRHGLYKPVC